MLFITFAGGDWMVQYRFIVPAIPFISLLIVICVNELFLLKRISMPGIYMIGVSFILMIFYSYISEDKFIIQKEKDMWNRLKELSSDIKNIIPSGSLAANGASGIIPFYLDDIQFLDVVGLTNKAIAKEGYRHGNWFEKSFPEYVYSRNPDWIIMWKRKNRNGVYTFESASPCYFDLAMNENFKKYSFVKSYDVYDDVKVELYRKNTSSN